MLDTAGKILEQIIHGRIEEVTDLVVKIAKETTSSKRWKGGENEYCLVVALDIKNIFNSTR